MAKIIIIEDDPLIALDLKSSLSEFGHEIIRTIDNGEEAISKIPSLNPDFVLMDINIKGKLDGIDTASKLNQLGNYPIVFLTGDKDEETLQRAKLTKPYGYLIKPFDANELHSTVELTLYKSRQDNSALLNKNDIKEIEEDLSYSDSTDKKSILKSSYLFKNCADLNIEELSEECVIKTYDAGQYIVQEGDKSKGGFLTLTGRVSVSKSSPNGKDLIVALLAPGNSFSLFYLLDNFTGSIASKAQLNTKVLWIPKSSFNVFINKEPLAYKYFSDLLAQHLIHSHVLSSSLAHAKVEDRIIKTLINLLPQFYNNGASKQTRIFITRRELADLTGTTPETAIRITKNLEREGLLDLSKPGIIKIIDEEKLESFNK